MGTANGAFLAMLLLRSRPYAGTRRVRWNRFPLGQICRRQRSAQTRLPCGEQISPQPPLKRVPLMIRFIRRYRTRRLLACALSPYSL